MAAQRILLGAVLAGAVGGQSAFAQSVPPYGTTWGYPQPVQTTQPPDPAAPQPAPATTPPVPAVTQPASSQPPASEGTSAPSPSQPGPMTGTGAGTGAGPSSPGAGAGSGATNMLTAPPGLSPPAGALPPGSYGGPWVGGLPAGAGNCGGPVGANGPVTYELYVRTGPNFIVGGGDGGDLFDALDIGWTVAGGGRTLLLNQAGDAGWVLDLGLQYTFTDGRRGNRIQVLTPQGTDAQTGQLLGPDEPNFYQVRTLHRTSFNYAVGRDWFLNGPGYVRPHGDWNSRFGVDLGGRWGTGHVDLIPLLNPNGYLRKQDVFHSIVVGAHLNWEKPFGATILFGGFRVEYGYTWTNLVPPQDSDLQDLNLLLTVGARF